MTWANSRAAHGSLLGERPDGPGDYSRDGRYKARQAIGAEYARSLRHLGQPQSQVAVMWEAFDSLPIR